MKKLPDLFNNNTVNIFTDSSVTTKNGVTYSSSGAIAVYGKGAIVDRDVLILRDSTNNIGELLAVFLGLLLMVKLRPTFSDQKYNLFSDSSFSIRGLTDWLPNWYRNSIDEVFMNSSHREVSHYLIFQIIIRFIVNNNLNITMNRVRGHIDTRSDKQIKIATDYFNHSNYIAENKPFAESTVEAISFYNNYIDEYTRDQFNSNKKEYSIEQLFPMEIIHMDQDILSKYFNLIQMKEDFRR